MQHNERHSATSICSQDRIFQQNRGKVPTSIFDYRGKCRIFATFGRSKTSTQGLQWSSFQNYRTSTCSNALQSISPCMIIIMKLHTSCRFCSGSFLLLWSSSKVTTAIRTSLIFPSDSQDNSGKQVPLQTAADDSSVPQAGTENSYTESEWCTARQTCAAMNEWSMVQLVIPNDPDHGPSWCKDCVDTLLAVDVTPIWHQHDAARHHKLYTLGWVSKR